jgi:hypothetical protein
MKAILAILGGLGIGAALMYLFDPEGGDRRRALLRDKATKFNRQTREAIEGKAKDISNRTKGLIHDVRSTITHDVSDSPEQPRTIS